MSEQKPSSEEITAWFVKVCSSDNFKQTHAVFDEVFTGKKDENFQAMAAFFYAAGVSSVNDV